MERQNSTHTNNSLTLNSLGTKTDIAKLRKSLARKKKLAVKKHPGYKVGLDGLKLCFIDKPKPGQEEWWTPNWLFNALSTGDREHKWTEDMFTYRVTKEEAKADEALSLALSEEELGTLAPAASTDRVSVKINVLNYSLEDPKYVVFGTLTVCQTKTDPETGALLHGHMFLTIANSTFYNGEIGWLPWVAENLYLSNFNNVTKATFALTGEADFIRRFNTLRRDLSFDMVYNRKSLSPKEKLKDACFCHGLSRVAKDKQPTIYLSPKKDEIKIRIYNKARELRESSPQKAEELQKWYGKPYRTLQRVEAEIKNEPFRELLATLGEEHGEDVPTLILSRDFQLRILREACKKVVYWRRGNDVLTLF